MAQEAQQDSMSLASSGLLEDEKAGKQASSRAQPVLDQPDPRQNGGACRGLPEAPGKPAEVRPDVGANQACSREHKAENAIHVLGLPAPHTLCV